LAPVRSAALQLTPEQSGSSHTSAEGIEPSSMNHPEHSPHVTVSEWGDNHQQGQSNLFGGPEYAAPNGNTFGSDLPTETIEHDSIHPDDEGGWKSNNATGRTGIGPDEREEIEIPTLKEEEERRRIEHKNIEVEEWRSQAGGSDAGDELPGQSYFPLNNETWFQQNSSSAIVEQADIAPLDDSVSLHENRLVEGQTYFNVENSYINEVDKTLIMQPRHWNDAPSYPSATATNYQPATSNEAMMRFMRSADTISIASRAATWGTRRRSEPSLADWESVADGSFLKKLSISRSSGRPRKDNLFDQGLDRLAKFTRKRSDAKLKRARSSQNIPEEGQTPPNPRQNSLGSLAPPSRSLSFGRRQTPSVNTTIAAMAGPLAAVGTTHTRSGSVSANITSPKSPGHLGFANRIISRARSKSDLSGANDKGLAGLWRGHGGPPVATLGTPQAQPQLEVKKPENPKIEIDDDDEDDEDDQADEGDMNVDSEVDPIVANYEGFKAHVRRLNPDMDPKYSWLVSRIAHQQEIRYKNLLDLRVKHSQAINNRSCSAGPRCLALGGSVTLTDAKGNPRDSDRKTPGLQLVTDFSDDDSNPGEGAITDETFPQGVPMPPTRNLPAEFECQLCFKAKKFQKPSDWTKHVHEDVQPFTCTYDKCKEPKSFKRKADWVRHENERHRHLEWWICQVDDCRHPCYRKDNFLQHLVREHKLPEPKQKTKAAIKKARLTEPAWVMLEQCHHETQNMPQDEPCKFCGKAFPTWKKLTVHLAKHMEHISLPVLRLVEIKNVDANTIISPVEQILTPITPVGRTKMEPASPFSMSNVSPHVPMTNHFSSNGFNGQQYFQTTGPATPFNMQTPIPQEVQYGQNLYPNAYNVHHMDQPRAFGSLDSGNMGQSRGFDQMDTGFTQPRDQSRGFGSLDSSFSQALPNQNFIPHQTASFSMAQPFSAAPAVSGYQSSNMLGISDTGFGFDPMAVNQPYQQVPMSRAQGSASSYGHSPQHYYGP
jgi:hypothetical protein